MKFHVRYPHRWLRAKTVWIYAYVLAKLRGQIAMNRDIMDTLRTHLKQNMSAIVIGCGGGFLTKKFYRQYSWLLDTLTATDTTALNVECAAQHCECEFSEPMERFVSDDGILGFEIANHMALPIEDESLDLVICPMIFYRVQTWEQDRILAEIYRVLKPGEYAIITDHGMPRGILGNLHWHAFCGHLQTRKENCIAAVLKGALACGFAECQVTRTSRPWIDQLVIRKPVRGRPSYVLGAYLNSKRRPRPRKDFRNFRKDGED